MNAYLSDKIKVLSFILIMMVLYIHTFYTESEGMEGVLLLENTIGAGLCSVAVPLFYVISGYLFFLNIEKGIYSVLDKMKKRVYTLVIPYILCNLFCAFFLVVLNLIIDIFPSLGRVVYFRFIDDQLTTHSLLENLYFIFVDPLVAFQLWFLRCLIVVILFAPLLYFLIVKLPLMIPLIVIFILALVNDGGPYLFAFQWFMIGGVVCVSGVSLNKIPMNVGLLFFILYLLISISIAIDNELSFLSSIIPYIGIVGIWTCYDMIVKGIILCEKTIWKTVTGFTFFIYLIHEPFLNIVKKLPLFLLGKSEWVISVSYLLTPIVFVCAAIVIGQFVKKYMYRTYSVYVGGR